MFVVQYAKASFRSPDQIAVTRFGPLINLEKTKASRVLLSKFLNAKIQFAV